MQILINSPGTSLSQKAGCFLLENEEKRLQIAPKSVDSIVISNRASITSQAIILAVEHNIDLLILDHFGAPVGRFWYSKMGRNAKIRQKQLQMTETLDSLHFALPWFQTKLKNQLRFLKQLRSARPRKQRLFGPAIERIENVLDELELSDKSYQEQRNRIMGLEGIASRVYFQTISSILPPEFQFEKRSRRPAQDPFNAALNYVLGILYGEIERACLLAGLDTQVGFLHSLHPYRPALVCDMIEPFRVWAETVIVYLFTRHRMKKEFFDEKDGAITLNAKGKQVVIPAFTAYLQENIRYQRRNIKRGRILQHVAHLVANRLLDPEFSPENWELISKEF